MAIQDITTRACKSCKKLLHLEAFALSHASLEKSWRRKVCKACILKNKKVYRESVKIANKTSLDYSLIDKSLKKMCQTCKESLFISEFHKDASRKDGFGNVCRQCSRTRLAQWYEDNKETSIRRICIWRKDNPEKVKEYNEKYRTNNHDRVLKASRDFYQNHVEVERERSRKKKNKRDEVVRGARYRAQKLGLPSEWKKAHAEFAFRYWHYMCAVCGTENGIWHVIALDHWIPIASDMCPGTIPGNMVPLCHATKGSPPGTPSCNQSKGAKLPNLWLTEKLGPRKTKAKLKEIETFFGAARLFSEKAKLPSVNSEAS